MEYDKIKFWHKVQLKDGTYTNGKVDILASASTRLLDDLDFKGKSVLDVGCWDGGYSFYAEQKGAARVVSFDCPSKRWGWMDGYNFLHDHFQSKCEVVEGDVYKLDTIFKPQEFDIVLCYGVLYHLSDPMLAMRNVFSVSKTTVTFEGIFGQYIKPVLELWTPEMVKRGNKDTTTIYRPSLGFMDIVSKYYGFELKKTSRPWPRMTLIYERTGDATTQIANTVFPTV